MDIGTAKPDAATLARTPHRLIDFLDPEQSYSAGEFVRDAYREMDAIFEAGRLPLLVGGTMMYFRALTRGIARLPGADAATRAAIDAEAEAHGWPAMHAALEQVVGRHVGEHVDAGAPRGGRFGGRQPGGVQGGAVDHDDLPWNGSVDE